MKLSRMGTNRNVRRAEKIIATAALSAAVMGTFSPIQAATKTWTGTVVDSANAINSTSFSYFTPNSSLYKWDTSALNWSSGGVATTYAASDDLVFTDNFNSGTLIEVSSGAQSPKSMDFVHIGAGVTNYNFLNGGDFQNVSGGNIGSSSPFGTGHTTVLTLESNFNGTVAFRTNSSAGAAGESITVKGGTLELHTSAAIPNSGNTNAPNVMLAGGQLNVWVDIGGNVQPASSNLIGTLSVLSNSVIANAANNAGRVWGQSGTNGTITLGNGTLLTPATLTFESITGGANSVTVASVVNLATGLAAGSGTVLLQDFNTGAGTFTTLAASGNFSSASINFDLGTGHSTLAMSQASANLGALFGGANTTLSGSGTTFNVGSLGGNTTFSGNVSSGTFNKVGPGRVNLAGVNTTTLALNASAGTLALAGPTGTAQAATYVAAGGVFMLDNSGANNNDRLNDTTPVSLNQGSFEFVGNLGSQSNEVAGPLTIGGANTVTTTDSNGPGSATITFSSLVRNNGIVNFNLAANTHVRFQASPALSGSTGFIGGFATTNNFQDWASLDTNNNVVALTPADYNNSTDPTTWNSTSNVRVSTGTITLAGSTAVQSIKFDTATGGVVIPTGTNLNVVGGGILANSSTTFSGGGTLTAGSGSPIELDLVVPTNQTLTINTIIADNGAGGTVSLLKVGAGTLVLGASNTFSGALAIAGGTLSVNQANLLSPTGGLTVDLGTTFDLNGFSQNVASISLLNGTIKNTPGGAAVMNVSGLIDIKNGTMSANLSGAAPLTKTGGGSVTFSGSNNYTGGTTISSGTLNVANSNALPVGGSVTFTGGTTVLTSNATVGQVVVTAGNITNPGILTSTVDYDMRGTNAAGQGLITAVLAGNVGLSMNRNATPNGSINLNAANTYTGVTTISDGTLATNNIKPGLTASGLGASAATADKLILDGQIPGAGFNGAFLVYTGGSAATTDRLFTIKDGANNIVNAGSNAAQTLTFSGTGAILKTGGGSLSLRGQNTGNNTFTPKLPSDLTLAKNDTGQWILGQTNTIDKLIDGNGTLTINAFDLTVNNASFTAGSLIGTGHLFVNNDLQFAGGTISAIVADGTGPAPLNKQIGNGTLSNANTFTGTTTIHGGNLNVAVLADGGVASGIGKSSSVDSNLHFTDAPGTVSYYGATAASTNRQFQLDAGNSGFASSSATAAATLTIASTFVLDNHSNTLLLGGTNAGTNGLVNVFNPTMINSGGLTKADGGAWQLTSNSHTYSGNVTLNGGTLVVSSIENAGVNANITTTNGSNVAAVDSTTGLVAGQLVLNQNGATNDHVPGGTTITAVGTGTVMLSQNATQDGGSNASFAKANALGTSTSSNDHLDFNGGTLRHIGAGTASTNREFTVDSGGGGIDASGGGTLAFTSTAMINNSGTGPRTFRVSGSNTGLNTLANGLQDGGGSLSVTKSGNGQWVLTGTNTYTGTTTVQTGTLNLVGTTAWGPALSGNSASIIGGTVLTGGRLNFDYSTNVGDNPATTIKNILTAGAPGKFQAGQIRTTTAPDGKHGIGWIDDSANSKVRVGYTYLGDANVDGVVNTGDFNTLALHFNNANLATPGAPVWAEGDFNYDGKVNMLDFNGVATNFGAAAIAGSGLDAPSLGTLVPEPASLGLLGSIALLGVRRRRPGR